MESTSERKREITGIENRRYEFPRKGERFIYDKEESKPFSVKQTQTEFQEIITGDCIAVMIDPELPMWAEKQRYIAKLQKMKEYLLMAQQDETEVALNTINSKYEELIGPIVHAIKKTECILYLTEKCDMDAKPREKKE